jgi:hypothetical protein
MRRIMTVLTLLALSVFFAACAGESSREGANSTGTTTYNGSNSSPGGSNQVSNTSSSVPPAATPAQGGIKPPTDKKN